MGIEENRHATEVRLRLLNPPNAVLDQGIDLKRLSLSKPLQEPLEALPGPTPPEPPSNVLPFTPHYLTVMRVIELVAKHTGFSVADILSENRKYDVTFARHIAVWLCRKHCPNRSFPQLAITFKRDHSTVMHGRDRMGRYLTSNGPEGIRLRHIIRLVEGDIGDHS
jgi:hypothetical protein